jgi:hypothetical protein
MGCSRWLLERADVGEGYYSCHFSDPWWQEAMMSVQDPRWPWWVHPSQAVCTVYVSYTYNYPSSRLDCLHREQSFISKRAHFVSCDSSRVLTTKLWWLTEGQVRRTWSIMLSTSPGLPGWSKASTWGVHLRLAEKIYSTGVFSYGVLTRICFSSMDLELCIFVTNSLILTK